MTVRAFLARVAGLSYGSWPHTRVLVAFLLVLLYASASTVRWLHLGTEWPARSVPDEISANDQRFEELRSLLPDRGVVGYMGHPELTGAAPAEENSAELLHFRRFLLAQYALAPVVLIKSVEPEFVVGNFDPGAVPPPPAGLQVVRRFGDGLVLFRHSGR